MELGKGEREGGAGVGGCVWAHVCVCLLDVGVFVLECVCVIMNTYTQIYT